MTKTKLPPVTLDARQCGKSAQLRAARIETAAMALLDQLKGKRFNDGTAGAITELRKALKS